MLLHAKAFTGTLHIGMPRKDGPRTPAAALGDKMQPADAVRMFFPLTRAGVNKSRDFSCCCAAKFSLAAGQTAGNQCCIKRDASEPDLSKGMMNNDWVLTTAAL